MSITETITYAELPDDQPCYWQECVIAWPARTDADGNVVLTGPAVIEKVTDSGTHLLATCDGWQVVADVRTWQIKYLGEVVDMFDASPEQAEVNRQRLVDRIMADDIPGFLCSDDFESPADCLSQFHLVEVEE